MITHRFVGEVISDKEMDCAILMFVILKILDVLTTFILLDLGGYEMNPIISFIIYGQPPLLVFMYFCIIAFFTCCIYWIFTFCIQYSFSRDWVRLFLVLPILVYLIIDINNINVIRVLAGGL